MEREHSDHFYFGYWAKVHNASTTVPSARKYCSIASVSQFRPCFVISAIFILLCHLNDGMGALHICSIKLQRVDLSEKRLEIPQLSIA